MILYGARGQAKVIYDLILSNNQLLEYLIDDNPPEEFPHHLPIYRPEENLLKDKKLIIAIGNNKIHERISKEVQSFCVFETMIHRNAYISRFTEIY